MTAKEVRQLAKQHRQNKQKDAMMAAQADKMYCAEKVLRKPLNFIAELDKIYSLISDTIRSNPNNTLIQYVTNFEDRQTLMEILELRGFEVYEQCDKRIFICWEKVK